uniref:CH082 protein n=1 Tax=Rhinopithecus roxellana TaxID=61622 RepID=A0A2K6RX69_RHIRO
FWKPCQRQRLVREEWAWAGSGPPELPSLPLHAGTHHGPALCLQLFLDDSKMKNFITCFKDPQFLVTFFSRLRPNRSGRYEAAFPFLSPCGRERNFLRCEDRPVVFTHLLTADHRPPRLSYCGGGEALAVPFEPARLLPLAANGRLYHPAPERAGGVGLVRSALAFELSACFEYGPGAPALPSHVRWQGRRLALTM